MALLNLPTEIIELICTKLDTYSKIQLSKTCHLLNNIVSSKSVVSNLDLSEVLEFDYNDLHFIKEKSRCQNIRILNIDNWYWIPRKELMKMLWRLSNLEELFALDTKLKVKDIGSLIAHLPKLNVVSFTIWSCDLTLADLKPYIQCFRRLSKIFVELNTVKPWLDFSFLKLACGDRFYTIRKQRHRSFFVDFASESIYPYYLKNRNVDNYCESDLVMQFDLNVYNQMVQWFLPDFENVCLNIARRHVFTDATLFDVEYNTLDVQSITKLCLYGIVYNFKDKQPSEVFRNIRELSLNTHQLYDVAYDSVCSGSGTHTKKRRLGIPSSAQFEEQQPIRTVASACPELEVLCIAENPDMLFETTLVWYPNCLKSISLWTKLKRLTIHKVESRDGRFLKDLSLNCPDLMHLSLYLVGPRRTPCFLMKDLCVELPRWKKLQYINIHFNESWLRDLFTTLAKCTSLRIVMISNSDKILRKKGSDITYENLCHLISSLDKLLLVQVIDARFSGSFSRNLQSMLRNHFVKDKPILSIHVQHEPDDRELPLILAALELRHRCNWVA